MLVGDILPTMFIGSVAGPFQHLIDQRFGRENYGQKICPAFIQKQLLQFFRSIGKGRRTLGRE